MEYSPQIERKRQMMVKEFDTAVSWYQHFDGQISGWRGLTTTLLLAYFGFLCTIKGTSSVRFIFFLIPIPFLLLEVFRRAHLTHLNENIRHLEDIFSGRDEDSFIRQVQDYVFRDQGLHDFTQKWKYLGAWGRYALRSLAEVDALIWYIFIILFDIAFYIFFSSKGQDCRLRPKAAASTLKKFLLLY